MALLPDEWFPGWDAETAFVREFCALGGRVAGRVPLQIPAESPSAVLARIPRDADGVAVLGSWLSVTPDLLDALARRGTGTLVLGPEVIGKTDLVRHVARLEASSQRPMRRRRRAPRTCGRTCATTPRRIPARRPASRATAVVMAYRNGVEAVLQAFELEHGDLSDGRRRLRARLARLTRRCSASRPDGRKPPGRGPTSLVRLGPESASGVPELSPVQSCLGSTSRSAG